MSCVGVDTEFGAGIVSSLCNSYAEATQELLSVVRDTEASLRRLGARSNASNFADSSAKINMQLTLDVEKFETLILELQERYHTDFGIQESIYVIRDTLTV